MEKIKNDKQSGATLATSLILLFLVTLLSFSAMQTTILQERMSSNTQNSEIAFQATESALVEAEDWLLNLNDLTDPVASCSAQPCVLELNPAIYYGVQSDAWWNANSAGFSSAPESNGTITGLADQPRYRVEYVRFVPDDLTVGQSAPTGTHYFRATSRGGGATSEIKIILQSTVGRRF